MTKLIQAEQDVKSFFNDEWNDEKHRIHCSCVVQACLGMAQGTNLDPVVFMLAGWLHDMGKLVNDENHHIESMKFVDRFLEKHPEYAQHFELVQDCILSHRTGGMPKTIYARIFQLADKVALVNLEWIAFKKKTEQ